MRNGRKCDSLLSPPTKPSTGAASGANSADLTSAIGSATTGGESEDGAAEFTTARKSGAGSGS